MSVIDEIIRLEADGTLSFGDYRSSEKKKLENFESDGNTYKVKTYEEITRLERDGKFLLETVPGAAVHHFSARYGAMAFSLEGADATRVTAELEPNEVYRVLIENTNIGNVKANIAGKVIFSLDLDESPKSVEIIKM